MSDRERALLTTPETEASVRKSVSVDANREHAFAVFTQGFDSWWMRSHHIGDAEMDVAVIEPCAGGRWYEKGVDGSECDWGYVIAWDPPRRLVLAWQINGQWEFDPSLVTEVEVIFTEETPTRTRVDLEHRDLNRMGQAAEEIRGVFESETGWAGILRRFAAQAEA